MRISYLKYRTKRAVAYIFYKLKKFSIPFFLLVFLFLLSKIKLKLTIEYTDRTQTFTPNIFSIVKYMNFRETQYRIKKIYYLDGIHITLERKKTIEFVYRDRKFFTDLNGNEIKYVDEKPDVSIYVKGSIRVKDALEFIKSIRYNILEMHINHDYLVLITSFVAVIDREVAPIYASSIINKIDNASRIWIFKERVVVE